MKSDRGVIVIIVALALFSLTVFTGIVTDAGILYVARAQAQNAVDSAALTAAFMMVNNPIHPEWAQESAIETIRQKFPIWGEYPAAGDIVVTWPLPAPCPPPDPTPACITVEVYRGGSDHNGVMHTNPLPTVFVSMLGISSQAINATATVDIRPNTNSPFGHLVR